VAGGTAEAPEWAEPAPGTADRLIAESAPILLRPSRVKHLLGIAIEDSRISQILTGFGLRTADGLANHWIAPSYRADLTREVDLIEELIRVEGIEKVPGSELGRFTAGSRTDRAYDRMNVLRQASDANGLFEARSITLIGEKATGVSLSGIPESQWLRVKNPMIEEQVVLRPTLLPGLLQALSVNLRGGTRSVRLFEIGRVFSKGGREEGTRYAMLLSGPTHTASWKASEGAPIDLTEAKHLLQATLNRLGVAISFTPAEREGCVLSLNVVAGGKGIGFLGHLHPAHARDLGSEVPVLLAEIDFDLACTTIPAAARRYTPVPRFPGTSRDIALLAPLTLQHAQITATLLDAREPLLVSVTLFDIFTDETGQKVPTDKKSLAYSLEYRALERTLTTEEVNTVHQKLKELLVSKLGVALRE
jgi:phenylalanyl-tRNA synthetase beta chain